MLRYLSHFIILTIKSRKTSYKFIFSDLILNQIIFSKFTLTYFAFFDFLVLIVSKDLILSSYTFFGTNPTCESTI